MTSKIYRDIRGFTLVEMAIVTIITGLTLIPLVQLYESMTSNQKLETTKSHMEAMKDVVSSAHDAYPSTVQPHYPCPSDRALAPTAPEYRKEFNGGNCDPASLLAGKGLNTALVTATTPVCTANFGFCVVLGAPGTDFDGNGKPDFILIGGVPIASIGPMTNGAGGSYYPPSYVLDGWGNNFTYAVSMDLVVPGTLNINANGGIAVTDENNLPTSGINNNGHYVIVSHGPDGKGTFTNTGSTTEPCGASLDSENCDNDFEFKSALGFYQANTPAYYDDLIFAELKTDTGIWENIYDTSGNNTSSIHNLNALNVGIGTNNPLTKLDVNGKIRADYTTAATTICKDNNTATGTDCFNINAITSTGVARIHCPAGQLLTGIANGVAVCSPPPATVSTMTPTTCPTGQYVHGFNLVTGEVKCQ